MLIYKFCFSLIKLEITWSNLFFFCYDNWEMCSSFRALLSLCSSFLCSSFTNPLALIPIMAKMGIMDNMSKMAILLMMTIMAIMGVIVMVGVMEIFPIFCHNGNKSHICENGQNGPRLLIDHNGQNGHNGHNEHIGLDGKYVRYGNYVVHFQNYLQYFSLMPIVSHKNK